MYIYANRYERIKDLGQGTTGSVELVKDQKTTLLCALKILKSPLGTALQKLLDGFKSEFHILKNLNHPSIAQVYDAGIHEDEIRKKKEFYIATEFVEGQDLFDATENASIEVIEDLLVQSLRALNYLHSQKVFHFDIKPQNMLVSRDAAGALHLKVIDFGMANFFEHEFVVQNLEKKKFFVGTMAYVSPEIIKGESYDGRSDLYSLGCTFFKAFTRNLPFRGEVDEIEQKHLNQLPPIPSTLNSEIPEYLDKVLFKLLEKDPLKRYQTAQAAIEDINFFSGKSYQIETPQTVVSYLPEKGQLVGRDLEFAFFKNLYEDRLLNRTYTKKPYLIVTGESGTGKTRFLQECKNDVQKHFIKTMSWQEFGKLTPEAITESCLVLGDDVTFDSYDIDYLNVFFENLPVFIVLSTVKENTTIDPEYLVELKNFTKDQTKEYLAKATGIDEIPDAVLKTIDDVTGGNLTFLSGYVRVLFEKGFFKDSEGSWSKQLLDDFAKELEQSGATEFIKRRLIEKLEKLHLGEAPCQLLNILALTGKPTLEDLEEMTDAHVIDDFLKTLVKSGVLEVNLEDRYIFSNPLYREIFLERIPTDERSDLCDHIADHYEAGTQNKEKVLYFRGRGRTTKADESLLELAWLKRRSALYQEAIDQLLLLLSRPSVDPAIRENALLEVGETFIEMGQYEKAEQHLAVLMECLKSDQTDPMALQASEQMGVCCTRMGHFDRAKSYFLQVLRVVQGQTDLKWVEIKIENRLGQLEFDLGHMDAAESIFKKAWVSWKTELNEEEKYLAAKSNLDTIYFMKGQYREGIQILEEMLEVLSKKPNVDTYPIKTYGLARQYLKIGETKKAEQLLLQALEMMKDRRMYGWLAAVYNELGSLYYGLNDRQGALVHYQHAFDVSKKMGRRVDGCAIAFNMANIYLKDLQLPEAKKYYGFVAMALKTETYTNNTMAAYHLFMSMIGLTDIYRLSHQYDQAERCLNEVLELINTHETHKLYQQYYWQEKADLEKNKGNIIDAAKFVDTLEKLKPTTGFDLKLYEEWLLNHQAN